MIKRIIFDIDNTLIPWNNKDNKKIDELLDEIKYPKTENLYKQIDQAQEEYQKARKSFSKAEMLNYINEKLNLKLPSNFIESLIKKYDTCVPKKLQDRRLRNTRVLTKKIRTSNTYKLVQRRTNK